VRRLTKSVLAGAAAVALLGTACGGDSESDGAAGTEPGETGALTVYSGRNEEFIGPLFEQVQADTGIELEVRYGDSAELAAQLLEEGGNTPADVFVSQDAGSLGAVAAEDLFEELDPALLERVDRRFRDPQGRWVGASGRARVAAYNTDALADSDLPDSIMGFTEPEWKGRIGFPPTNASFQAFIAAMISTEGEDAARSFLKGLVANDPKLYEDNSSTVRAVAAGEIDVGFVNHYYIYEVAAEDGDIPVANHFFTNGDPGALINAAGAGILAASDQSEDAARLIDYLTGDQGQTYFAEETWEYPVVSGHEPQAELVPLDEIESPDIDLSDLAGTIEPALNLLAEVGLL
jgi:iron(III) transport system substrate-binding protein